MRKRWKLWLASLSAVVLVAAGCGGDPSQPGSPVTRSGAAASSAAAAPLEGSILVSAATSLTDAFTELADGFAAANPGVEVAFNIDGSSALAAQLIEGAPADVFASADAANMARVSDQGLVVDEPQVFASNELVIVTQAGNPEGIGSLADLGDAGVISLCEEEVPCGRYAAEALAAAGATVDESRVTRGQNTGATLAAVAEGDAVAGIVYVTDARSAGDRVEAVTIPAEHNVVGRYPIGVLARSENVRAAEAFVSYVLGDEGQGVLARHGFLAPASR